MILLSDLYLRTEKYGHLTIFVGHRVIDDSERLNGINRLYVDWGQAMLLSDFIRRLEYLKRYYRLVSLDEAVEKIRKGKLSERMVALTFDDGYVDCKTTIFSSAKVMGIPVVFFLSPAIISSNNIPWWDKIAHYLYYSDRSELILDSLDKMKLPLRTYKEKLSALRWLANFISKADENMKNKICDEMGRKISEANLELPNLYMTWDDISKLAMEPLCTIGAHTVNHTNLCAISENKIMEEVMNSKKIIERVVQKKVRYFAYPHGYYDKKVRNLLAASDYDFAFAVENGRHDDFFAFRRVNLSSTTFPVLALESAGMLNYLKYKI